MQSWQPGSIQHALLDATTKHTPATSTNTQLHATKPTSEFGDTLFVNFTPRLVGNDKVGTGPTRWNRRYEVRTGLSQF